MDDPFGEMEDEALLLAADQGESSGLSEAQVCTNKIQVMKMPLFFPTFHFQILEISCRKKSVKGCSFEKSSTKCPTVSRSKAKISS